MGLFSKKENKTECINAQLAEGIFRHLQSEGFFPEMEETDRKDSDIAIMHFKFQGTNVSLETAQGSYVRIVMIFDHSSDDTDFFNLQCAASQTMYEMRAVKIVVTARWIQFSVETFTQSAEEFTPFLKQYLDILSEAVGRFRILYTEFTEDKHTASGDDAEASSGDGAMESFIEDAINLQGNKSVKS